MTFGQPINPSDKADSRITELIAKIPDQFSRILVFNVLPILRFVPIFRNFLNNTLACTNELYALLDMKIENTISQDGNECFVNCFVEKEGKEFDRTQLKGTVLDLFLGGTETVSSTVLWTIVLLANHQNVQERLQKEIDSVIPKDGQPSIADLPTLRYV